MKIALIFLLVIATAGGIVDRPRLDTSNRNDAHNVRSVTPPSNLHAEKKKPLRSEDLQDVNVPENLMGFETLVGRPGHGSALLADRLACLDCHRIAVGDQTGFPSLAGVGRRLSPKQLVTSILEPSRAFAPGYKSVTVLTSNGTVIRGVELQANSHAVVMQTDNGKQRIRRDKIEEILVTESDMPKGQADGLTRQEFADVIAYLSNLTGDSKQ